MKVASVTWQDRIERAQFLAERHEAAGDILRFYARILEFQESVQEQLSTGPADVHALVPFVPDLLQLLTRSGTPPLKELAASSLELNWSGALDAYWNDHRSQPSTPLNFALLTLLQPFARGLASHAPIDKPVAPQCPFCFRKPQLGVLHPEGEGAKRYLLCSLCGTEWEYRRVICPNCEETDKEKLPVYKSDQHPHLQLAACDTCHTYLKCVDLSIDGHAIPEIDDLASLPLSLWMVERGFRPVHLNLFGF